MSDNMFKPFLLDGGFTKEEISRWTGVYGMVASTLGSMSGGFVVKRMAEQARPGPFNSILPPLSPRAPLLLFGIFHRLAVCVYVVLTGAAKHSCRRHCLPTS